MDIRNRPIGVFDSGLGGLTVVRALNRILPNEDLIYVGDTARFPFGNKSQETIARYSTEISDFLLKKNVKMIAIACNSASALGLDAVRNHVDVPVLGVIGPGARTALRVTKTKRIGVIGTRGTISSSSYTRALLKDDSEVNIFAVPTPLLVPLAEEGWSSSEVTRKVAETYLQPLIEQKIDTLILGCTHYPLLKSIFAEIMGNGISLVDSADALAVETQEILASDNLSSLAENKGNIKYYATDTVATFVEIGQRLINLDLSAATQVAIP